MGRNCLLHGVQRCVMAKPFSLSRSAQRVGRPLSLGKAGPSLSARCDGRMCLQGQATASGV